MTRPIYQVKADFFKTLGHPARIRVLELLRDGECSVAELIPGVGIEASHLSQQLGIMRRANILQVRQEGAAFRYSVTDPRCRWAAPGRPDTCGPPAGPASPRRAAAGRAGPARSVRPR